jgi:hypothetical protein
MAAIYNTPAGELMLNGCTLTNNISNFGGAIENQGTLSILDCQIYGNSASIQGNDIFNSYDTAKLTIHNSIEEYRELFTDFDYPTMGWYYDRVNARYDDNNAVPLSIPVESLNGYAALTFAYQPVEPQAPQTPDDDTDDYDRDDDTDIPETTPTPDNDNDSETPKPDNDNNDSGNNDGYTTPTHKPSTNGSNSPGATTKADNNTDEPDKSTQAPSPLRRGNAVLDLSSTAYLLGYGDGDEHRQDLLTRAQMVTILYRLLTDESREAVYSTTNPFSDCEPDAWYNEAISTIANAGVVVGVGGGKFDPNANLTWSQIITIFARFIELQANTELKNIDIGSHWSADYVKTAVARRWIADTDGFEPDALVTRGEMVDFINHVFDMEQNDEV